ncbi:MAG: galactokinase [bacterium]
MEPNLPSYFKIHEGYLIAASISKYVYVTVSRPFEEKILLKYSNIESISSVRDIKHPIIREALVILQLKSPQIEITTLADIPSGTGLGSSGSFTTALLKALFTHYYRPLQQKELAELACHIEIERLHEPIGKQDQYIAAYGGITSFVFQKNGQVIAQPLQVSMQTLFELEDQLLLFFTGFSRSAGSILKDQNTRSTQSDQEMLNNLHYVKELGYRSKEALESGNTQHFGELMNEHWEHKKRRSGGMSNSQIDQWYQLALQNGAIGGKLVGAGGGGFLMFLAEDRKRLRKTMSRAGLEEVRFRFDFEGTKIILSS